MAIGAIICLMFFSAFFVVQVLLPGIVDKVVQLNERRTKDLTSQMDRMFLKARVKTVFLVFTFGPAALALLGYLLVPGEFKLVGTVLGAVVGFIAPSTYVKMLDQRRKFKFQDQLIDVLMVLSSSLRGGLSLIQAMEVVIEEIPSPANEEFGIVLGENKMGVSLEDSMAHLYKRIPSSALDQMITAILLARETGGNLPAVFQRIILTIRENKKIQQNLDNLTLQGKIQGGIMTMLPVVFAMIVTSTNPKFFDQMFNTPIGRSLLFYAFISEVIGAFLIWRISRFREF